MGRGSNTGFTLMELLVVVATIGTVAAVGLPGLMRARIAANEASAIGSLRSINSGQATYAASAARGGYATSLAILGTRCGSKGEGFVSPGLGKAVGGVKSGYTIAISAVGQAGPRDCNNRVSRTAYLSTATPVTLGRTGRRSFISNQSSAIYATVTAQGVKPKAAAMIPANAIQ